MASAALDLTRNFSFYTIPAAWATAISAHWYAISLGKFDNKNPRSYVRDCDASQTIDKASKAAIARAEAAQANGFENLGLFAAAVVAGNLAKLDNDLLNKLTGGYVLSRMIYNYLYIRGSNDAMAGARSLTYITGIGIIFTLFIKCGNALRDSL